MKNNKPKYTGINETVKYETESEIDTHKCFNNNNQTFTAPISGDYSVTIGDLVERVPTGNFNKIHNPNRQCYQFWKPKFLIVPEYKKVVIKGAYTEVVRVGAGQVIKIGTIKRKRNKK